MEMHDTGKTQSAALNWLYEMEALDSPVLRQNLYENIFMAHLGVKDCKLFITPSNSHQKGVLIWLKLKFWSKFMDKDEIYLAVTQIVNKLLPSYRIRIVDDVTILELAEKRMKELYGGLSDSTKAINTSNSSSNSGDSNKQGRELLKTEAPDILPDSEKQAEDKQEVCNEAKQLNSQVDSKIQSPS